ncbi:hypothetical protein CkaCkLH20_11183 [Colletotrichum karsti]|uniref:Reverse transcriptase domain-containing protein n=1 Tax=Colletotrichum karsti TaxID=1095194 RepID=A0A9P6LGB5_9PEZI|nr:uncharacterized protein CkaCkLH20_11183 [Colletotrichum karsti]KAF9871262.1 hypothetical protein CkaCkLH20_11183 [Colletotrichum karsti]
MTGHVSFADCGICGSDACHDADLVIVQVNLKRANNRHQDLLHYLKILQPLIDIVAIQDPPPEFGIRKSGDYDVVYHVSSKVLDDQSGDPLASSRSCDVNHEMLVPAAVGFYVHRRLRGSYECFWWDDDVQNHEHVVTLGLDTATGRRIEIHNVYNRNNAVNFQTLLSPSTLDPHSILLGDFNLHHPNWGGPGVTAPEPDAIYLNDETQRHNMRLTTPVGLPTFHPSMYDLGRFFTIDLCWVGEGLATLASQSKILDQVRGFVSDHHPIQTVLHLPPIYDDGEWQDWPRVNVKAFNRTLRQRLNKLGFPTCETTACVEQYAKDLVGVIVKTISDHVPVVTRNSSTRKSDPAADIEVQQACEEEDRAVSALWDASPGPESRELARVVQDTQSVRRKAERQAGSRSYRRHLDGRGTRGRRIFRIAKRAMTWGKHRQSHLFPRLKNPDGTESADVKESFKTYAHHMCDDIEWEDDGYEHGVPPLDASSLPDRPNPECSSPQRLLEGEIDLIMDALGCRKSPGPDNVHNRALKIGRKIIQPHIEHLMRASIQHSYYPLIFRKGITVLVPKPRRDDYSLPSSWRPITLLSSIGKIMERVITDRLTQLAVAHGCIPETQFGRKGASTVDALEYLLDPVYKAWCTDKQRRIYSTLLGLDVKGAYDHVDRKKLLAKLVEIGVPEWMIKWIASFLSRRSVNFRAGSHSSDTVWLKEGVPQGSPLSPILFILSAAEILELARSDDPSAASISFAYSDDIDILVQSKSWQKNCDVLVRIHETINTWSRPRGIHFDPSKYAVMHFRIRGSQDPRCTLLPQIPGLPADCLKRQMRVLGVKVDDELTWKYHVVDIVSNVMTKLHSYRRLSGPTWGAKVDKTKRLYVTSLRSMISYACPVWYVRPEDCRWRFQATLMKLLERLEYQCLLWVSGAMRGTPAMVLLKELQIEPISVHLQKLAMRHRVRKVDTPAAKALEAVRYSVFPGRTVPPNVKLHPFEVAYNFAKNTVADVRKRSGVDDATWLRERRDRIVEFVDDLAKQETVKLWQKYQRTRGLFTNEPTLRRTKPAVVEDWDKSTFLRCIKDVSRAKSTMLIQLRSGRISLRAYQASIDSRIPAGCDCGSTRLQTAEHMLCHCPKLQELRNERMSQLRHNNFYCMLSKPEDASIATEWAILYLDIEQFDRPRAELEEAKRKQKARSE